MNEQLFVNFIMALMTAGIIGLVKAHLNLKQELSEFKLVVAKEYANTGDMAKMEKSIEGIREEVNSILEILYEVRADLRAGNLRERT